MDTMIIAQYYDFDNGTVISRTTTLGLAETPEQGIAFVENLPPVLSSNVTAIRVVRGMITEHEWEHQPSRGLVKKE